MRKLYMIGICTLLVVGSTIGLLVHNDIKEIQRMEAANMERAFGSQPSTILPESEIEPEQQKSDSSQPTAEDDLKEATEKAKKIAENLEVVKIEDGLVYNNIISLHEKAEVFESRDKTTQKARSINVKYFTDENDKARNVTDFMNFIEQVYVANDFDNSEYFSFGFKMHENVRLVCVTTFIKDSNGGISTSNPLVIGEEYKVLFEEEYNKRAFFTDKDIVETFKRKSSNILSGVLQ